VISLTYSESGGEAEWASDGAVMVTVAAMAATEAALATAMVVSR